MTADLTSVAVGDELPPLTVHLDRGRLVRYAGASGDFNPIHWNPRVAADVGLPDVIAHGMLTMAVAGRIVTDWLGDPGPLAEYGVRFTRPVVVADPDGAEVGITAKIGAIDEQARTARIDITATFAGKTVLGKSRAVIRLP
ncbi:MaoC family dehydratase [Nakamurella lactea]|uniref:MaoC family dehydratase n=1 Tax=Nakamurella lactea TaxID=459515 RepID=UPI000416B4D3|nr:MaoC family dehydratase [Nakamurella lactea]